MNFYPNLLSGSSVVSVLLLQPACTRLKITGGGIYDAIIAQAALKANVDVLLTMNSKHFTRLGEHISRLVRDPSV